VATRTIVHVYDRHSDAVEVVSQLEAAGIPNGDISVVANQPGDRTTTTDTTSDAGSGAGTGATAGAVLGGGAGLLAGLGALAIPGVGPVVAAGWLIATLAGAGAGAAVGAATGGIIGSLTDAGVPEREANVYAEGVRRGGTLVTVRTDDSNATRVKSIMESREHVDWQKRDQEYRTEGWQKFDPAAAPYTGAAANRTTTAATTGSSAAATSRVNTGAAATAGMAATTAATTGSAASMGGVPHSGSDDSNLIAADRVSGTTVYDPAGEKLGSVEDVMLDKIGGRVRYAVLSFGGFMGMGDRHYPLPWESLKYDTDKGGYVVNVDRQKLEGAPSYASGENASWNDRSWSRRVYEHYGATPYWDAAPRV